MSSCGLGLVWKEGRSCKKIIFWVTWLAWCMCIIILKIYLIYQKIYFVGSISSLIWNFNQTVSLFRTFPSLNSPMWQFFILVWLRNKQRVFLVKRKISSKTWNKTWLLTDVSGNLCGVVGSSSLRFQKVILIVVQP